MQDSERPDPPARAGDDREFFIGRLRVRVARGLLESPDGKRIQLEPRVMQVLVKLASRPGEVMTRRDLEDSVWPGMVVSDDALNRCIYHLRHALDALLDGTDSGPPVETLRKRGYRLRLPVHAAGHDPVTASPQLGDEAALDPSTRGRGSGRGVLLAAAVLCIALIVGHGVLRDGAPPSSTPTSVAVLPFLNLTGDPALEVVADGFAEQLLHDLVSVPGLRVAARTSSFFFKNQSMQAVAIADRLDVDLLIEGSLRQAGHATRITVQLIDRQGFHVWSGEFNRSTEDVLGLQSDISRSVLDAMDWQAPTQSLALPSESIANYQAYDQYLRGRFRLTGIDDDALDDARRLFREALELEPGYARAYTGLADAWSLGIWRRTVDRSAAARAASSAIEKALAIDATLSEAHASRGLLHLCRNEYGPAEAPLRRAIELNPNLLNAHTWLGLALVYQDRFADGVNAYLEAQRLDPMDPGLNRNLGANLLLTGEVEAGLSYLRRAQSIEPSHPLNYQMLADWNRIFGRLGPALEWANRGLERDPEHSGIATALATALLQRGEFEQAERIFDRAWELDPGAPGLLSGLFSLYLATGDRSALDALLERDHTHHGAFGQDRIVLRWALIRALLDDDPHGAIDLAESRQVGDALTCNAFMEPGPLLYYAFALRRIGDFARADPVIGQCRDALRRTIANGGRHPKLAYRAALIALLAGDSEAAAEHLADAGARGWSGYWQAWNDPLWREARSLPEFKTTFDAVLRRIRDGVSEPQQLR